MPGTLIVDAANVVGSVPDGWWRDRPGAAARLHAALVAHPGAYARIVLVLEGRARGGVPEGVEGPVTTVHAPGSGDDAIAELARTLDGDLALATADQGLIARVPGVRVVGPRTVRDAAAP